MATLPEYAILSARAYRDARGEFNVTPLPPGWAPATATDGSTYYTSNITNGVLANGLSAEAYKKGDEISVTTQRVPNEELQGMVGYFDLFMEKYDYSSVAPLRAISGWNNLSFNLPDRDFSKNLVWWYKGGEEPNSQWRINRMLVA